MPGKAVVDNDVRVDLKTFAKTVWGRPGAISKHHDAEGFEYIDLGRWLGAFQTIFGAAIEENILVRDEYRTAVQELQTDRYSRGAYVTGQSGTGKTLFLVYLLVRLLEQRQKVAVHDIDHQFYVIFTDKVTFHPLVDKKPLRDGGHMWALSDSNHQNSGAPPSGFYSYPQSVRMIQATSPKKKCWHEWRKQARAECYVMDIWTEREVTNLAKLMGLDVHRMVQLHKKWGGAPRTLLDYLGESDEAIESSYRDDAIVAAREGSSTIISIVKRDLSENLDALSKFYFCRPANYAKSTIDRTRACAVVPTQTICYILGAALQHLSNTIRSQLFTALSRPSDAGQAADFIYKSRFHTFICAANKSIACHWLHDPDNDSKVEETLPYYWYETSGFAGIEGALIRDDAIFAFQINISSEHPSPEPGLRKLRNVLPPKLRNRRWHVVFVGNEESLIEAAAKQWAGKVYLTKTSRKCVPVAWSKVDPVEERITDESEEELMDEYFN
ncbi:hypothetical protein EV363DRAFT_1397562 [Boletus edulis]|nr:hypothetical protein EV363DRAFT_1397562 [Boletus edulis]